MKKNIIYGLFILFFYNPLLGEFKFTFEPIDAVVPCHPKDIRTIDLVVEGIKKNVKNLRRIIVVSATKLTDKAEWFDESNYPFSKKSIAYEIFKNEKQAEDYLNTPLCRIGWIYQQMLKAYSIFVIPDISSNVLVVDADTVFLQPVEFQDPQTGAGLYNPGTENHTPYFDHNERVLPGWKKVFPQYSGISHHMLLQRDPMEQLYRDIEIANNGKEAWKVFCDAVDKKEIPGSCMCIEYELYFNYIFAKSNLVKIRHLKWDNISFSRFNQLKNNGYHYLSCHTYIPG